MIIGMMNSEACHGACPQATTPLRPVAAGADSVCGQKPHGNLDVPDVYPGHTLMLPVFHDGPTSTWETATPRKAQNSEVRRADRVGVPSVTSLAAADSKSGRSSASGAISLTARNTG